MNYEIILIGVTLIFFVTLGISVLVAPELIRTKRVRALAQEFGLSYKPNNRAWYWNRPLTWPIISSRLTWKKNILQGTINQHSVEIADVYQRAGWPSAPYIDKQTIFLIDNMPCTLPRNVIFSRETSIRVLRKKIQELAS